jgi:hydroxymethylglutaryl-CoA synthase
MFNKELEKDFMAASKGLFEKKTKPSLFLANQVGNMYSPSVYGGIQCTTHDNNLSTIAGTKLSIFAAVVRWAPSNNNFSIPA